jgi:uncharacterized protein YciI
MSTKHTHTHRGHCQLCIRVQAIDMRTGEVAKHGYSVPNGYYVGTCPGSGEKSLHAERRLADAAIKSARERAAHCMAHVERLNNGTATPDLAWSGRYVNVEKVSRRTGQTYRVSEQEMIPFAQAPAVYQGEAVRREVFEYEAHARNANDYANDLTKWAADIFDKEVPAYRVKDLEAREWQVGDTLRIGGKKGFDAKIEAIEERDYRSVGYRRGSVTIKTPHALVTYPAVEEKRTKGEFSYVTREAQPERKIWEALRNYKREVSPLFAKLKEAGML